MLEIIHKKTLRFSIIGLLMAVIGFVWLTAALQEDSVIEASSAFEESGNINLAIRLASDSPGLRISGEPEAIYGKAMNFREALERFKSTRQMGPAHEWMYDQTVYVYVFEDDFHLEDERLVDYEDPWAQLVVMFDAATGEPFGRISRRESIKYDTSDLEPVRRLPQTIGGEPRQSTLSRIGDIPEPPATVGPVLER